MSNYNHEFFNKLNRFTKAVAEAKSYMNGAKLRERQYLNELKSLNIPELNCESDIIEFIYQDKDWSKLNQAVTRAILDYPNHTLGCTSNKRTKLVNLEQEEDMILANSDSKLWTGSQSMQNNSSDNNPKIELTDSNYNQENIKPSSSQSTLSSSNNNTKGSPSASSSMPPPDFASSQFMYNNKNELPPALYEKLSPGPASINPDGVASSQSNGKRLQQLQTVIPLSPHNNNNNKIKIVNNKINGAAISKLKVDLFSSDPNLIIDHTKIKIKKEIIDQISASSNLSKKN